MMPSGLCHVPPPPPPTQTQITGPLRQCRQILVSQIHQHPTHSLHIILVSCHAHHLVLASELWAAELLPSANTWETKETAKTLDPRVSPEALLYVHQRRTCQDPWAEKKKKGAKWQVDNARS